MTDGVDGLDFLGRGAWWQAVGGTEIGDLGHEFGQRIGVDGDAGCVRERVATWRLLGMVKYEGHGDMVASPAHADKPSFRA